MIVDRCDEFRISHCGWIIFVKNSLGYQKRTKRKLGVGNPEFPNLKAPNLASGLNEFFFLTKETTSQKVKNFQFRAPIFPLKPNVKTWGRLSIPSAVHPWIPTLKADPHTFPPPSPYEFITDLRILSERILILFNKQEFSWYHDN